MTKVEQVPGIKALDYKNLTGDAWKEYNDIMYGKVSNPRAPKNRRVRTGGISVQSMFMYDKYRVKPVKEENETGGWDIVGIKLDKDEPVSSTFTFAKFAHEANGQFEANCNHAQSEATPIYYYLMRQEVDAPEATDMTEKSSTKPAKKDKSNA